MLIMKPIRKYHELADQRRLVYDQIDAVRTYMNRGAVAEIGLSFKESMDIIMTIDADLHNEVTEDQMISRLQQRIKELTLVIDEEIVEIFGETRRQKNRVLPEIYNRYWELDNRLADLSIRKKAEIIICGRVSSETQWRIVCNERLINDIYALLMAVEYIHHPLTG